MRRALLALAITVLADPVQAQSLEDRRRALAALNAQESALTAQIGANRNELAHLLSALQLFSRDPPPPLLVSPRDARDAVNAMILARAIAPELEARARTLSGQAQALALVRRKAAEASGDLFAAESAIDDRQGRLDALAGDAALLAPPSARAAAEAQDGGSAPTALIAPADGPISTPFGGRLQSGLHARGLAWRTDPGAAVRSPAAAVVVYAGPLSGWGEVVILKAGGGCHLILSGLGKVNVSAGETVAAAFALGAMPSGGHPPPELYLEVRMAGGPIDPTRLMGSGATDAARGAIFNADGLRLRREGAH